MPDEQDKKPEFEVIRREQPAESGASPMALGIMALLLVVVGAFFAMQSGDEGDGAEASPTPTQSEAPDEPAPDFVWEQIDFRRDQGDLQGSLEAIEEALADYPNARALKARRSELLRELNPEGSLSGRSASSLKIDAENALRGGDYEEALDLVDAALAQDENDAELYFMRGRCLGELGQKLEALSALEEAKLLGVDASQVDPLIERYR